MRLLKRRAQDSYELVTFRNDDLPPYAILSHTWKENQEVTYTELLAGKAKQKDGFHKLRFCAERALQDGLQYFWVDTCCIDKSTSDELSTAINSMFSWYRRANKCYAYLADVVVPDEALDVQAYRVTWEHAFRRSRWFTRGWTVQELLAPATVEFFSQDGRKLGSKISLEREIHEITRIPISALRGENLLDYSFGERIGWTARRRTTVPEDKIYSLLGIFGVFMPLIYGEGEEHAYLRLEEEAAKRLKREASRDISSHRRDPEVGSSKPSSRATPDEIGPWERLEQRIDDAYRLQCPRYDFSKSFEELPLLDGGIAICRRVFEGLNLRQDDKLDGERALPLFHASGLPNWVLALTWNITDTEQISALTLPQFIVAMHVLVAYKKGYITSIPRMIPTNIFEEALRRSE